VKASPGTDFLLRLKEHRYRFGRGAATSVMQLVFVLTERRFPDNEYLIHFHESLLFLQTSSECGDASRSREMLLFLHGQFAGILNRLDLTSLGPEGTLFHKMTLGQSGKPQILALWSRVPVTSVTGSA